MNLKTSIILGLTLTLLSIVSCSKSDSVDPINPSNIIAENTAKLIGSWEIENIITANCTDPIDNDTLESGCETEEGSEVCLLGIQTFFQDNTFSLEYIMTVDGDTMESETDFGNWEILNSDNISITTEEETVSKNYVLTDNTFSMISTDGEFGCDETINAIKTNN